MLGRDSGFNITKAKKERGAADKKQVEHSVGRFVTTVYQHTNTEFNQTESKTLCFIKFIIHLRP